ncbi:hypothetical protein VTK56DRAFT_3785 [Thermocarpiscus australiensis]
MAVEESDIVDLPLGLRKRFYEPLVLLYYLRSVLQDENGITKSPDLESVAGTAPRPSRRETQSSSRRSTD